MTRVHFPVLRNLFVGALVGLSVSLYRYLIPVLGSAAKGLLTWADFRPERLLLLFLLWSGLGLAVGFLVRREPLIGGSGIPQVAARLQGRLRPNALRVFAYKFVGGLLTLGAGLTVGREGPSIQMGASLAEFFLPRRSGEPGQAESAESVGRRPRTGRPDGPLPESSADLIAAAAAAGLTAAFHAPLAGIAFALEELLRRFSPAAFVSVTSACLASAFVSECVLGSGHVILYPKLPTYALAQLPLFLLLGILVGFSALLFNNAIMGGKRLYAKLPLPTPVKVLLPFALTFAAITLSPELFGAGDAFMLLPLQGVSSPFRLILLYGVKLLLLILAFCSGLPGGIFFPMLVLGSLLGSLFGSAASQMGLIQPEMILFFSAAAMAAHFAAIVRSPITGMLLLIEMTAAFDSLLPLGLTVLAAYLTIEALHGKPVYDSLLDFLMKGREEQESSRAKITRRR